MAGYLLKDAPSATLAAAIGTVHGGRAVDPTLAADAWAEPDPLTDRKRQVLCLAGDGQWKAGIAARVHLSEGTVRNYLSPIRGLARRLPTRPSHPASLLGSVAPVAVFPLVNAAWGLVAATIASTAAARGPIGWPVMATVIFVCEFYARFWKEGLQGPPASKAPATACPHQITTQRVPRDDRPCTDR